MTARTHSDTVSLTKKRGFKFLFAKADELATFLGRKLTSAFTGEAGNDFHTRIQGTPIRHHRGPASLKLYDKFALMARVECTANDVSFFRHHRFVEQRNGCKQFKLAPLRKNLYSLPDLRERMQAANERYLSFMASIDNPNAGLHKSEPFIYMNLLWPVSFRLPTLLYLFLESLVPQGGPGLPGRRMSSVFGSGIKGSDPLNFQPSPCHRVGTR